MKLLKDFDADYYDELDDGADKLQDIITNERVPTQDSNQGTSAKMNNNQLKKNIEAFKNDEANLLIATNVVEEGLDVS